MKNIISKAAQEILRKRNAELRTPKVKIISTLKVMIKDIFMKWAIFVGPHP
jgi:hypothetical protein